MGTDPAPHVHKTLRITYSYCYGSMEEHSTLTLP